ncbi:TetR/AcrR family transcriptional regulator [Mycobacteroides salmoniphilum]|uniref:Bacterial regulatory protein, tetR family n=1 Tax=Mycobacteroides salmoniphilum TaxID=404941 RepID=A0A4R8SQ64_9MYCO|nr:TetR/AcrR family transcriptional regulator [Mycobacteroides salmoniphilum]TEA01169.1 Bacterial regulatory protein, tetR family [Mycobacteroides salmoniphilum]
MSTNVVTVHNVVNINIAVSCATMCADRPYHHGDLREQLLESAERALRDHGVEQLSLRRLAKELGVTHNAPSRHFRDKQALLDALALAGFRRLGDTFHKAVAAADIDFEDRFRVLARAYLDFALQNSALLTVMFARKHSQTAGAAMDEAVARAFAVPVTLTAEAQARGEVAEGDPLRIGWTVAIAMQGLASFVASGLVVPGDFDDLLDETVTRLMQGLRRRDAP